MGDAEVPRGRERLKCKKSRDGPKAVRGKTMSKTLHAPFARQARERGGKRRLVRQEDRHALATEVDGAGLRR